MTATDFLALDRWAACQAASRGAERETFVVIFDDARLVRVRPHSWTEGNVTHVTGYDVAYFETQGIAELFARWTTFRGERARAVRV